MKKKTLLLPIIAGLGYILLTSEAGGFGGLNPANDYTGSQTQTCGNCHQGSSTTTTATFSLVDKVTSQPVTNNKYTPGKTYIVTLNGVNSGSLIKYGYQAEALNSSMISVGTLTVTQSSQHLANMNGNRQLIESTARLTGTSASTLNGIFDWTAPSSGTGTVTFYGVVNAVNGTGGTGGDACSPSATLSLAENTSSVEFINAHTTISLYPNPTDNILNVSLDGAKQGNYSVRILNLNCQEIVSKPFTVTNNKSTLQINVADVAVGLYQVVVASEGWNKAISFVKN